MVVPNKTMLNLPDHVLYKILHKALECGLAEFTRTKATCKTLRDIDEDPEIYRSIDFFNTSMNLSPREPAEALVNSCITHENPSALIHKGLSNYIYEDKLLEGESMLKRAAESNLEIGLYLYAMLIRVFYGSNEVKKRRISLTRELTTKVGLQLHKKDIRVWPENPRTLVLERRDKIDINQTITCKCASINQWLQWWENGWKKPKICDECYWTIESLYFCKIAIESFGTWPLPAV